MKKYNCARAPTPEEEEEIRKLQVSKINLAQKRFRYELKKQGIKPNEHDKIQKIIENYDVVLGPMGSCIVYNFTGLRGRYQWLPPGVWPKFSWFGFNDRAESILVIRGVTILYEHTWWDGTRRWYTSASRYDIDSWFRNRASSAIVG